MADNNDVRAEVLARLRARLDRLGSLVEVSPKPVQQPSEQPDRKPSEGAGSSAGGLEAVLRAEHRATPPASATRILRRASA